MSIFKGAGVAIVTPMKSDLEVNYDKLAELLEEQIAGKTDAIHIKSFFMSITHPNWWGTRWRA